MTSEQQSMIEMNTQDVIIALMERRGLDMEEAMDLFYGSAAFEKLNDERTGLYLESPDYLMELFERKGLL